jgi:hypothetical protein
MSRPVPASTHVAALDRCNFQGLTTGRVSVSGHGITASPPRRPQLARTVAEHAGALPPGGPTSITGTARFVPATFHIASLPSQGALQNGGAARCGPRVRMGGCLLDIAERDPGAQLAVMNACLSVCGVTALPIPARRAALRRIRPAPCRSSRRPSAARNTGPPARSPTARSIARAVRGASGSRDRRGHRLRHWCRGVLGNGQPEPGRCRVDSPASVQDLAGVRSLQRGRVSWVSVKGQGDSCLVAISARRFGFASSALVS